MTESDTPQEESPFEKEHNYQDYEAKIREMQDQIGELKKELAQARSKKSPFTVKPAAAIPLLIGLLLAAIPPALVVADRWFFTLDRYSLQSYWCTSDYLCLSMWPSYFLIVFACYILLLIFLFTQRKKPVVVTEVLFQSLESKPVSKRQADVARFYLLSALVGFIYVVIHSLIIGQFPGWSLVYVWLAFMVGCVLQLVTQEMLLTFWKERGELCIAILLMHVSIVAVIAGYYAHPDLLGVTVVLLCLASANLWRFRRQVPAIFWIMSLALVVYSFNLTGWWTAAVGDEYTFHAVAWNLAEKTGYSELGRVLFQGDGAQGTHPYFSSILQAISMKIFGHENFGWRFSNPYICSLAVGLFYLFCKSFLSRQTALTAAFLLAVSSYIMSFSKIGYNNLQSLFALTLVLAAAGWALRSRTLLSFASLGSVLAFCFYIYPAGLYVVPLPFLLFILYYPPTIRERLKGWAIVIFVLAALIFPLFMQPVYWQTKVLGTFFNQPTILTTQTSFFLHILNNFLYSLFSFLYISSESHFVAASYLDPISAAFFSIGFFLLLFQTRRQKFPLFSGLMLFYFIFSVGVSHDRQAPPNTRMFLLLPAFALISAWGLIWVKEKTLEAFSYSHKVERVLGVLLLVSITFVNMYQAYPVSHLRFPNMQNLEALFIRVTKNIHDVEPNTPKTYVFLVDENWSVYGLLMMQKVYPHLAWAQIKQITLKEPEIPESWESLLKERDTLVMVMPWMDPEWKKTLDPQVKALDKEMCQITTYSGEARFPLYYAPDLPQGCNP